MSWDKSWGERASVTQARYHELFTEAEELRAKVSESAATINSLTGEVDNLLSLERGYTQTLGEMARLCSIVLPWAASVFEAVSVPAKVREATAAIAEYVECVRPPEGSVDPEWVMHIIGPDDVIDMPSQFAALKAANDHNKAFARLMADDPSPNDPYCVALAKNKAAESV